MVTLPWRRTVSLCPQAAPRVPFRRSTHAEPFEPGSFARVLRSINQPPAAHTSTFSKLKGYLPRDDLPRVRRRRRRAARRGRVL